MIGKPISEPVAAVSRMPFSTDGIYSFGMLPPLTSSLKMMPEPRSPGVDRDLDAAELARAARLLLVGVVDVDLLREILAIRHLRRADVGLDLELALHAIDEDLEVELAHPLDDRLARFMIGRHAERRILARRDD